jgi:quercetin dioxygenase-like cupin family protein
MLTMTLPHARPRAASSGAAAMLIAGGAAIAGAVLVGALTMADGQPPADIPHPRAAAAGVDDPTALTTSEANVSVVGQVYEPGQSSGWHAHSGVHAVAVLSGTLTVYDERCQRTTYEPGRPYVGGRALHLVTNETETAVELVVTYLSPMQAADSNRPGPPPAGCTPAPTALG